MRPTGSSDSEDPDLLVGSPSDHLPQRIWLEQREFSAPPPPPPAGTLITSSEDEEDDFAIPVQIPESPVSEVVPLSLSSDASHDSPSARDSLAAMGFELAGAPGTPDGDTGEDESDSEGSTDESEDDHEASSSSDEGEESLDVDSSDSQATDSEEAEEDDLSDSEGPVIIRRQIR